METTFWQRLKQRKIVQWALGYLAAAIAVLEGTSILTDTYNWSPVIPRVTFALVGVGFLAALVIAWFHGERGQQRVPAIEVMLLAGLALVGGSAAWWAGTSASASAAGGVRSPAETLLTAFDPATATRSVAVLPFLNMSGDPTKAYLADGVTEDIIAELGSLAGLRVISRTSVMRYRNTDKDVRTIGAELGVGTILEGSVRVQDNQVRIVAQLIDVATDAHLWSHTYDGDLKDIFGLQTRVATDVANALNARLLPGLVADAGEVRSVNPDAWRHYAQAKDLVGATDEASQTLARAHLDSAILLDPEFARAYEALAEIQTPVALDLMPPSVPSTSAERAGGGVTAMGAAERALELNPRLAGAQSAWAIQNAVERRDLRGAEDAAKRATQANPSSVPARLRYSQILALEGRTDEAMAELETARMLDPHSSTVSSQMGELFFATGQPDSALAHLARAVANDSTNILPRVTLAMVLNEQGRTLDALREVEHAAALHPDHPLVKATHGYLLGAAGRTSEALAIAKQLESQARTGAAPAHIVAQVYAGMGDVDEALRWLRQAMGDGRRMAGEDQQAWLMLTPRVRRTFDLMRDDPRFRVVFDSMSLRPPPPRGEAGRRGAPPDSARRGGRGA